MAEYSAKNEHPVASGVHNLTPKNLSVKTSSGRVPPNALAQFPHSKLTRPAPKLVPERRPKSHLK